MSAKTIGSVVVKDHGNGNQKVRRCVSVTDILGKPADRRELLRSLGRLNEQTTVNELSEAFRAFGSCGAVEDRQLSHEAASPFTYTGTR